MCASVCACVIFYSLPLFFSLRTNARSDRLNFNSIQFLSAVASQHSCAARLAFARVCVRVFFVLLSVCVCACFVAVFARASRVAKTCATSSPSVCVIGEPSQSSHSRRSRITSHASEIYRERARTRCCFHPLAHSCIFCPRARGNRRRRRRHQVHL